MRLILEWLGLVEPDRNRREPIALPAWTPVVVALAGASIMGIVGVLLILGLRALQG